MARITKRADRAALRSVQDVKLTRVRRTTLAARNGFGAPFSYPALP